MQNAGSAFEQGIKRVPMQKSAVGLLEKIRKNFESKSGSELLGLPAG